MALTYSTAIANARLDAVESTIGTSARLIFRTGAPPATVATASTGTILATLVLPSDWMSDASARSKSLLGSWAGTASANGTVGHFELTASNGTTVGARGTVTATGGGGDMTVDNTSFASGQTVTVTAFTLTAGN